MRWFRFQCYKENYSKVQKCSCTKYKVYHTVYVNDTVPAQVTYLSGTFTKEDNPDHTHGLLAPLYVDREKDLMLFSHHPEGLVWQVSQKLTTTPLRGVFSGPSCPDSEQITWEWYNVTTSQVTYLMLPKTNQTQINCSISNKMIWIVQNCNISYFQGQQVYVEDPHIHVKCISHKLGA